MKKIKILSFILALTLFFASMSTVAFADTEEPISIDFTVSSEYRNADKTKYSNCMPPQVDVVDGEKTGVIIMSSGDDKTHYTNSAAGAEPRVLLNGSSAVDGTILGDLDWNNYDYLKIETNIWIGDENDGLAFRTRRMDANGDEIAADHYFLIGGSSASAGTVASKSVTTGYTYVNKSLPVGEWHKVTIEIGAKLGNTDVKFYIDGELSDDTSMKLNTYNTSTSKVEYEDISSLPANTFGFCGGVNRCVLIPKSKSSEKVNVKLHDFKMSAFSEDGYITIDTASVSYSPADTKKQTVGYLKYTNTTSETETIVVVLANYDANHNLIKAAKWNVDLVPTTTPQTLITNRMNTGTNGTVAYSKQFIWKNLDGDIYPLYTSTSRNY